MESMLKYTVFFLVTALAASGIALVQKDVEQSKSVSSSSEQFFTGDDDEKRPRSNRTWKEVRECAKHNDQICVLKFPKTTAAQRKCFINATIVAEFAKAEAAFEKCVDKKIGSGDKCLVVGHRHHRQHFEQLFTDDAKQEEELPQELLNEIEERPRPPHPRPHPHPHPHHRCHLCAYTHCQIVEQWECGYGCRRLWGPKVRKFFECGKASFKKAFKLFIECKKHAELDENVDLE